MFAVDGGQCIYSSGPGVYTNMLIQHALGVRRHFGEQIVKPGLPASVRGPRVEWPGKLPPGSRLR